MTHDTEDLGSSSLSGLRVHTNHSSVRIGAPLRKILSLHKPLDKPLHKPLHKPLDKPLYKPLDKPLHKPLHKPLVFERKPFLCIFKNKTLKICCRSTGKPPVTDYLISHPYLNTEPYIYGGRAEGPDNKRKPLCD